jgi:hypothetical protein
MGLTTGRFPQTHEANPDTGAASAPEPAGNRRLARTFDKKTTRPMTTTHHHHEVGKSTMHAAVSVLVTQSSWCVADGVCGELQGWRGARNMTNGLNGSQSTPW